MFVIIAWYFNVVTAEAYKPPGWMGCTRLGWAEANSQEWIKYVFVIIIMKKMEFIPSNETKCTKSACFTTNCWVVESCGQNNVEWNSAVVYNVNQRVSSLIACSLVRVDLQFFGSKYFCLSSALHSSIGQNIKSLACLMSDVQQLWTSLSVGELCLVWVSLDRCPMSSSCGQAFLWGSCA